MERNNNKIKEKFYQCEGLVSSVCAVLGQVSEITFMLRGQRCLFVPILLTAYRKLPVLRYFYYSPIEDPCSEEHWRLPRKSRSHIRRQDARAKSKFSHQVSCRLLHRCLSNM